MPLFVFACLQVMDLCTTVVFLALGVQEANPIVRQMLTVFRDPIVALLIVKAAAVLLGVLAWDRRRWALLHRANVFFGLLVAWNVCALTIRWCGWA